MCVVCAIEFENLEFSAETLMDFYKSRSEVNSALMGMRVIRTK